MIGEQDKAQQNFELVRDWMYLKIRGKGIDKYLLELGYHSVSIYGAGDLGQLLVSDLLQSKVEIKNIYDNNAMYIYLPIKVEKYTPRPLKVDCIIVTSYFVFDLIKDSLLKDNPNIPILNLMNIIKEIG